MTIESSTPPTDLRRGELRIVRGYPKELAVPRNRLYYAPSAGHGVLLVMLSGGKPQKGRLDMAGALVAKAGGALMIVPIVEKIIDAYSEGRRLDFELAKVREQGAVARRALKLKERDLEWRHAEQMRRFDSADRALDGALSQLRESSRQTERDRAELRRGAALLMKSIVAESTSLERMRALMACYNDIQSHLRASAAASTANLRLGLAACERQVAQLGLSVGALPAPACAKDESFGIEYKEEC